MSSAQYITLILAIMTVVVWFSVLKKRNLRYRWISPVPITYALHTILFYVVYSLGSLNHDAINVWSSTLRMHGVTTIFTIGLLLLYTRKQYDHDT